MDRYASQCLLHRAVRVGRGYLLCIGWLTLPPRVERLPSWQVVLRDDLPRLCCFPFLAVRGPPRCLPVPESSPRFPYFPEEYRADICRWREDISRFLRSGPLCSRHWSHDKDHFEYRREDGRRSASIERRAIAQYSAIETRGPSVQWSNEPHNQAPPRTQRVYPRSNFKSAEIGGEPVSVHLPL